MDCSSDTDEDADVSSVSGISTYPTEAGSDEEEKPDMKVKVDPCLICAQPAVFYSTNGNPIKRELPLEGDYTYQQLVSNLCFCLKISRNEEFLQNDSFPFCDQCEVLLVKLSELNMRLKQMERTFRKKIVQAEEMYLKDGLYEKGDPSYLNFRKQITAINIEQKPNQSGVPSGRNFRFARETSQASNTNAHDIVNKAKAFLRSRKSKTPSASVSPIPIKHDNTEEENMDDHEQTSEIDFVVDTVDKHKIENLSIASRPRKRRKLDKPLNIPTSKHPGKINSFRKDKATGNVTYKTGMTDFRGEILKTTLVFQKISRKPPIYSCTSCLKVIPRHNKNDRNMQRQFKKHFLEFHSDHLKCKFCNEPEFLQFGKKSDLRKHLKEVHRISIPSEEKRNQKQKNKSLKPNPIKTECEICGKPFKKYSLKGYIKHMRSHFGDEEKIQNFVKCPICEKQITNKTVLKKHIKKFHSINPRCKYPSCGQEFEEEVDLLKHINEDHISNSKHANVTSFICTTCGMTSSNKSKHQYHLDTVHLTKQKCPACSRSYLNETEVAIHLACKHNQGNGHGEFICPECSKAFPSDNHLRRHLKQFHGILMRANRKSTKPSKISKIKSVKLRRKRSKANAELSTSNDTKNQSVTETDDRSKITRPSSHKKRKSCKPVEAPLKLRKSRVIVERNEQMVKRTYGSSQSLGHSITKDLATGSVTYETGFGNRFGTKRHILTFETVESENDFKCSSCSGKVSKETNDRRQNAVFHQHLLKFHGGCRQCTICKKNFRDGEELLSHLKHSHNINSIQSMRTEFYMRQRSENFVKGCNICGKPFDSVRSSEYFHHRLSHLSEEEKTQAQDRRCRGGWWRPIPNVSDEVYEGYIMCEICGELISDVQSGIGMKNHLRTHLSEDEKKTCLCSICGKKYTCKATLERHMSSVHSDGKWEASNSCKYPSCKQGFQSEKALKNHVTLEHGRIQEANMKLLCLLCGRTFTSTWGRHQHRLVHSKEKNHECSVCSRKFPLKDTLLMHLAGVHSQGELYGKFKCEIPECKFVFPFERRMKHHMRLKHGVFSRKEKS